jgi:hypothetical protein
MMQVNHVSDGFSVVGCSSYVRLPISSQPDYDEKQLLQPAIPDML